jgi:hypothetical protein
MDPDQTAQAGLDPCWSQTHYVGFVMMRLKYSWDTNIDEKITYLWVVPDTETGRTYVGKATALESCICQDILDIAIDHLYVEQHSSDWQHHLHPFFFWNHSFIKCTFNIYVFCEIAHAFLLWNFNVFMLKIVFIKNKKQ